MKQSHVRWIVRTLSFVLMLGTMMSAFDACQQFMNGQPMTWVTYLYATGACLIAIVAYLYMIWRGRFF